MYVVTVTFRLHPGQMDAFLPLMTANAATSRGQEPGCHQFDICWDGDEIFLYEVYEDRAAFDAHLQSVHFKRFDAAVADLIADKKVKLFDEVIR